MRRRTDDPTSRPGARRNAARHSAGHALLLRELRARRGALARIALWSVLESLPALLSGLAVSAAIDRFLARDALAGLGFLGLLLLAAAVGAAATRQLFPWLAAVVEPVRDAFVAAIVEGTLTAATAPVTESANAPASGERRDAAVVTRINEQVESLRNMLFGLLRTGRQVAFGSIAALVGLALLAPAAALVTGVLAAVALTLFCRLLSSQAARHRAMLEAKEDVSRRAGAILSGARDVIALSAEGKAVAEVGQAIDAEVTAVRALARANALRSAVVFLGGKLPLIILLAMAPWLLRAEQMTFGELVGAATYLTVSLEPALRSIVGMVGSMGLDLVVTLRRLGENIIDPVSQARANTPDGPATPADPSAPAIGRYDLAVRDLAFAYGRAAHPIVRHLDIDVPADCKLALVGASGIGKSTLANLLGGLLAPQRGSVLIGEQDIRDIPDSDLRRLLCLIPQEAYVFAGTLRENLGYLAPQAPDRELIEAATAVGFAPVIDRLGGLDARVGAGGVDLSNGEKQLVALTRVYLSPARIVILDEATSNLDPVTEAQAETALAQRPGTLIVIAHRISSARRAERILVLDGDTVQIGTHAELVRTSAVYADLVCHWNSANPGEPAGPADPAGPARQDLIEDYSERAWREPCAEVSAGQQADPWGSREL